MVGSGVALGFLIVEVQEDPNYRTRSEVCFWLLKGFYGCTNYSEGADGCKNTIPLADSKG